MLRSRPTSARTALHSKAEAHQPLNYGA